MVFSFMHAADLHLGCGFSDTDTLPKGLQQRVIDASLSSFANLIDSCLETAVDCLIIAGDIFESNLPSLRTQKHFVAGIEKLATRDIDIFLVTGNHDVGVFDSLVFPLPGNVYIFPSDSTKTYEQIYNRFPVSITGISYANNIEENLSHKFPLPNQQHFNIAILHGDVGGSEGRYSPVSLGDLKNKTYHYWALGHVHTAKQWQNGSMIQYPGVLQGRHSGETGEKGCYWVKVTEDKSINSRFLAVQDIIWRKAYVDLSQIQPNQLFGRLEGIKEKYRSSGQLGCILTLILTGATSCYDLLEEPNALADLLLDLRANEEGLGNFIWTARILDQTTPLVDWDQLKAQDNFLSQVLLYIEELEKGNGPRELDNDLLMIGQDLARGHGLGLNSKEVLAKARLLALKLLGEGG